ncbi:MAG TPA: hypothetical protein GXZ98_02155 [Firmicutes bacterium]|nr:hypothetical protein [Bacillota bacterium]
MKKPDETDFYIEYLKKDISIRRKVPRKKEEGPKEEIQKELRKRFEEDKEKHYCLF